MLIERATGPSSHTHNTSVTVLMYEINTWYLIISTLYDCIAKLVIGK